MQRHIFDFRFRPRPGSKPFFRKPEDPNIEAGSRKETGSCRGEKRNCCGKTGFAYGEKYQVKRHGESAF